jgi:dihydrofolate reductase
MSISPDPVRVEGENGERKGRSMSKVIAVELLTLDGVMQAPGGPEEDRRGGFEHGGWAAPYGDAVMMEKMAEGMNAPGSILLGRFTYEAFAAFWPHQPANPYTRVLNEKTKYVASRTLQEPLPWQNSTLLEGDALDAVARLREQPGDDIVLLGSGALARSLIRRGLVDEYLLSIHPLVLGSGGKLFGDDGTRAQLQLVDSITTTTGVVIATYRPAA